MKHSAYWVITSIGLWITGLILFFVSRASNHDVLATTASAVIAVGNLIFGLYLIANSHRFVNWSAEWYQQRSIRYWKGITVGDPGWNIFGVWIYRAIGVVFIGLFIMFIVTKLI